MPITKVPDSILDKIRCRCGQYLSKLPINIQDGESICKDCVEEQAPTPIAAARNTPYEALAPLFAFPCQYKCQGCPKYVEFNKLELHEAECSYRVYECPANLHASCNWADTITQMCQHYREDHSELYLESPAFKIRIDKDHETYRLYQVDDVLLLLQSKCTVLQGKVWFNMVCFKQADSVSFIDYSITLNNVDNKGRTMKLDVANPLCVTGIQMVPEKCMDVSVATIKDFLKNPEFIECCWSVNISDELKARIKNQQRLEDMELFEARNEQIKCSNCGLYMVPSIYRCCNGHVTCVDCKGYYNECKTCQRNDILFVKATDLEEISKSEQHYCRWLNCRTKLAYSEIRQHEQSCCERIYKCPKCALWSGILDELLNHFKAVHPQTVIYSTPSVSFNSQDYVSAYVIAHREIFKLVIDLETANEPLPELKLKIDVWYLGAPSFASCWEYKVTENSGNSWSLSRLLNHLSATIVLDPSKNDLQAPVPNSRLFASCKTSTSASIFGSRETSAPMFGPCETSAPIFGPCKTNAPIFGPCETSAPIFGPCKTNAPIFSMVSSSCNTQSQSANTVSTSSPFGLTPISSSSLGLVFQAAAAKVTASSSPQSSAVINSNKVFPLISPAKLHGSLQSQPHTSISHRRSAASKPPVNANGEPGENAASPAWRFYTLTISKPTLFSL